METRATATHKQLSNEDREIISQMFSSNKAHEFKEYLKLLNIHQSFVEKLRVAELREDDILIYGYQKSGCTWMESVVALLVHGKERMAQPGHGIGEIFWEFEFNVKNASERIMENPNRTNLIFSHLPLNIMPIDVTNHVCKMIYVVRNPMDVCLSFYGILHHAPKSFLSDPSVLDDIDHFTKTTFIPGHVSYLPWLDHVKQVYPNSHERVLFVTYEEMSRDLVKVVRKVASFLEKDLKEEELQEIVQLLKFDAMKENKNLSKGYQAYDDDGVFQKLKENHMRKGVAGEHKSELSTESQKLIEQAFITPVRQLGLSFDK